MTGHGAPCVDEGQTLLFTNGGDFTFNDRGRKRNFTKGGWHEKTKKPLERSTTFGISQRSLDRERMRVIARDVMTHSPTATNECFGWRGRGVSIWGGQLLVSTRCVARRRVKKGLAAWTSCNEESTTDYVVLCMVIGKAAGLKMLMVHCPWIMWPMRSLTPRIRRCCLPCGWLLLLPLQLLTVNVAKKETARHHRCCRL
ncbi:hypothetical protein LX32DRAFT_349458 [Colletotrichum zoysiae]|uniref:Uncharacterized protein n=1 Tax=Colletotrichum zoysiae TaxID=1216348 RepID=A0AAD9M5K0_9PEZI|nr:hypothetical protein LX32DRAFT_349458 [Colletotrichum zoysiae]